MCLIRSPCSPPPLPKVFATPILLPITPTSVHIVSIKMGVIDIIIIDSDIIKKGMMMIQSLQSITMVIIFESKQPVFAS